MKIKSTVVIIALLLTGLTGKQGFAALPYLRLLDSYYSQQNDTYLGLRYGIVGVDNAELHHFQLLMNYSINEKVIVGVELPYLKIGGADDSGVIGDIGFNLKFSIAQSSMLKWRISTDWYFRVGSGVIEEDAQRRVDDKIATYYPYTSKTPQFSPSIIANFLFGSFLVNVAFAYKSENEPGAGILDLNVEYDRLDFQISGDYYTKFESKKSDLYLGFRPALYFDFQKNISHVTLIEDGIYVTLELNFKLKDILKWKLYGTYPIYSAGDFIRYEWGIEIGKIL